jgi:hypothetical protein
MNYQKIYDQIISNRKQHPIKSGYIECHHIIPKSLGGLDIKENLIELSAREHFICHLLLTKIYPIHSSEWHKMIKAFSLMCWMSTPKQYRYSNNKHYEWLKKHFSQIQSLSQLGTLNSQFGKKWVHNKILRRSKKINNNEEIPLGWEVGRIINFDVVVPVVRQKKINVRQEKDRLTAEILYNKYISEQFSSVREFCRLGHYDYSHVSLTKLWKKYIPEFKDNVKQGKRFIRE